MKSTLRRLSAVAAAATTLSVVAGVLVAPSASAAITQINPNAVVTNDSAEELVFTFDGVQGGRYALGGNATFVRLNAPSDSFTVGLRPTAPPDEKRAQATLDTTDGDTSTTEADGVFVDGPLNAGTYDVTSTDRAGTADRCGSCFTILPSGVLSLTSVEPNSLQAGETKDVTLTGAHFERGTRIDLLLPGTSTVDPTITPNLPPSTTATPADDDDDGITTSTTLRRSFAVSTQAKTGPRDVRVTSVDFNGVTRTAVVPGGFSVNGAPLTSTTPTGGDNDPSLPLTRVSFNGTGLDPKGTPVLQYTADPGSATREQLTIQGTVVGSPSSTQITADFNLRNAAPAAYTPLVRNQDGSVNAGPRPFTVRQTRTTTVTNVDSDTSTATTTGTDSSQAAGTTKTFVVNGTNFAKGTRVTVSGTGVTTTGVEFLSATQLRATFQSTSAAAAGPRNVTATRTDGESGSCSGCYTVTAGASPSPSGSGSPSPSGSASPNPAVAEPTITVDPKTIIAVQEKAVVSGRSTPGATIEIHAYSRPDVTFDRVRSERVGADGTYSFEVRPSGNTRLFARTVTPAGFADSDSIVLTVRTSLNLKVARTGPKTYRFTGSLLPKRPGQLVTVFYENPNGGRTIAARARNAADGTYNVTRTFSGSGTFTFFTGTGTDNNNAANNSNRVRVTLR